MYCFSITTCTITSPRSCTSSRNKRCWTHPKSSFSYCCVPVRGLIPYLQRVTALSRKRLAHLSLISLVVSYFRTPENRKVSGYPESGKTFRHTLSRESSTSCTLSKVFNQLKFTRELNTNMHALVITGHFRAFIFALFRLGLYLFSNKTARENATFKGCQRTTEFRADNRN